ncbi:hypothetical protein L6452_42251 [Arctium lappa]|uniref:Uncharacterized protein n=1 Tax=Arctium lappa TaxID=4217 RepID=A0ACB8XIY9_ARCLA|nr:hypothetical protein L6452_42251 [Arctium lappa]
MMVVSHTEEGMASGSRPSLDQPTESQSQPSITISIPQSLVQKPIAPITNTYIRKNVKKAPSLLVPSPTEPLSPLMENSPLENIYRETTGVSPNPKEVLNEKMNEHMGAKAATTPASTEEVSGNINKTFPMATLGEQSSKGPRYNYYELMETMGNINMDVIKQGKDIEELKLIILSQQEQIVNLKNMVKRLVQKRKKKQYVLKRREPVTDAPQKGESEDDVNLEDAKDKGEQEKVHFEGEEETATYFVQAVETSSIAVVKEQAVDTVNAAGSNKAANTISTAELNEAIEIVQEVLTYLKIVETLIKAKHDTPKVTSKAKGVVIKKRGEATKKASTEKANKDKGKAKMVKSDQPIKKQKLVESDEALAKKMQADLEQDERVQVEKDREMAKALAAEINEAYQQSLATEMT